MAVVVAQNVYYKRVYDDNPEKDVNRVHDWTHQVWVVMDARIPILILVSDSELSKVLGLFSWVTVKLRTTNHASWLMIDSSTRCFHNDSVNWYRDVDNPSPRLHKPFQPLILLRVLPFLKNSIKKTLNLVTLWILGGFFFIILFLVYPAQLLSQWPLEWPLYFF